MKTLLINPPHTAIGHRMADEHLPPLGLLSVAGPLLDNGFSVELLDADLELLTPSQIADEVLRRQPQVIMFGDSGSSAVHADVLALCQDLKHAMPELVIIYGGAYPSAHWHEILSQSTGIDIIVRGEGEQTTLNLMLALHYGDPLDGVDGIAFRRSAQVIATVRAALIGQLDNYRVAWELINHRHYSCWGGKRAVVVQLSRGSPATPGSERGQRGDGGQWRHRDPVKLAQELARLHRDKGVELVSFADELPTGSRQTWRAFLEALIAEKVPLLLLGTTRAGDIVRDADILPLYRQAGVMRLVLDTESRDKATLQAIALLRQHGIISMTTRVLGVQQRSDRDYWHSLRQLLRQDPDQIELLYARPNRWTPFYRNLQEREAIRTDKQGADDDQRPAQGASGMAPWRVFAWFKLIEGVLQMRPKALARMLFHPDARYRRAMRWYSRTGQRAWFHEVFDFMFKAREREAMLQGPDEPDEPDYPMTILQADPPRQKER